MAFWKWSKGSDKGNKDAYEQDPVNEELQKIEDEIKSDKKRYSRGTPQPLPPSHEEDQQIAAQLLDEPSAKERLQKGKSMGGIQPEYSHKRSRPVDMEAVKKAAASNRPRPQVKEETRKKDKAQLEEHLSTSPKTWGFKFREESKDSSGRSR